MSLFVLAETPAGYVAKPSHYSLQDAGAMATIAVLQIWTLTANMAQLRLVQVGRQEAIQER